MADVVIENISRTIGALKILLDVSLSVAEGEFITLLGPSGCGKSTTLNALAGLDRPSAGRITVGGRVIYDEDAGIFVEPQFRDLGMMFQSYALWPHMTVQQNLAFTLDIRRITGAAAREKIAQALDLVDMGRYADRYPGELSGGQQQRVALARTLVYGPRLMLLDEPLSNLDAKLRDKARDWLRDLQRRTGVTTIYVTHDQTEALALSDRMVVMEAGRIIQIGTPEEIYMQPATPFVADFVGSNNIFEARVLRRDERTLTLGLAGGVEIVALAVGGIEAGHVVKAAIRPEQIALGETMVDANTTESHAVEVLDSVYQGARHVLTFRLGEVEFQAEQATAVQAGQVLQVRLPQEAIRVFAQA
jgi:iron(III) transport system ATP-binding protein